jgi:4'-phosphopantetheinyl transferase EntD
MQWPLDHATTLAVARIGFTPAPIDVDGFRRAGIDCPDRIAASVPKRRAEFFHGRLCARAAIRLLGREAPQIGIGPRREPLWPADLVGSITHAADLAAAVVLPVGGGYRGVGLDIETVLGDDGAREVGGVVASADETRYLAAFEQALGRNVPLTLLFSAKESFFKAVHGAVGRYFNFDALTLERIDLAARRMHFRQCEDLGPDLPPGTRHAVHFQLLDAAHVATVCLWRRGGGIA